MFTRGILTAVFGMVVSLNAFAYGAETRVTTCKMYATTETYTTKVEKLKHKLKLKIVSNELGQESFQILNGRTNFAPNFLPTTKFWANVTELREIPGTGYALRAEIAVGLQDSSKENFRANLQYLLALMAGQREVDLAGAKVLAKSVSLIDGSLRNPDPITEGVIAEAEYPASVRGGLVYKVYVTDCESERTDKDGNTVSTRIGH